MQDNVILVISKITKYIWLTTLFLERVSLKDPLTIQGSHIN